MSQEPLYIDMEDLKTTVAEVADGANVNAEKAAVRLEAVRADDNHSEQQSATAVALVSSMDDRNPGGQDDIPIAATQVLSESDEEPVSDEPRSSHRPSFISVTVVKPESPPDDVGISLEKEQGRIHISHIGPDGLFGGTPICQGDQVLSVNSKGCQDRSAKYVARLIRRAEEAVTLLVCRKDGDPYVVSTMVTKPALDSRVGIGIQTVDGYLSVSSIDPEGLFAEGILNIGDKIVSIGDISCSCMDATCAIELIRKEKSTVNIVAWTEAEASLVVATGSTSFGRFFLSLLWMWRRHIMIIGITFSIIAIIGVIASQTGEQTACEDLGQRPLPVARECP